MSVTIAAICLVIVAVCCGFSIGRSLARVPVGIADRVVLIVGIIALGVSVANRLFNG